MQHERHERHEKQTTQQQEPQPDLMRPKQHKHNPYSILRIYPRAAKKFNPTSGGILHPSHIIHKIRGTARKIMNVVMGFQHGGLEHD